MAAWLGTTLRLSVLRHADIMGGGAQALGAEVAKAAKAHHAKTAAVAVMGASDLSPDDMVCANWLS